MKHSRREQRWARTRQVEWIYVLVMAVGMIVGFQRIKDPLWLAALMLVMMLLGQLIWIWQYRVLDELGKLRFLKSFAVWGMFLGNATTFLMLWAMIKDPRRLSPEGLSIPPSLSTDSLYIILILSLVVMGLTNRYLRWRDES